VQVGLHALRHDLQRRKCTLETVHVLLRASAVPHVFKTPKLFPLEVLQAYFALALVHESFRLLGKFRMVFLTKPSRFDTELLAADKDFPFFGEDAIENLLGHEDNVNDRAPEKLS